MGLIDLRAHACLSQRQTNFQNRSVSHRYQTYDIGYRTQFKLTLLYAQRRQGMRREKVICQQWAEGWNELIKAQFIHRVFSLTSDGIMKCVKQTVPRILNNLIVQFQDLLLASTLTYQLLRSKPFKANRFKSFVSLRRNSV